MEEKKNFPEPVEALVVILLSFGSILFFAILLFLLTESSLISISVEDTNKYFYILGGVLFIVVPTYYVRLKKYDLINLFRLKPVSNEVLVYSLLIGITIGIVGDEIDRIIQIIIPMPEFLQDIFKVMVANNLFDWILLLLGTVFVAAIAEEILFRGFLQVTLEKKGDITRAVILASLSWALIHANPYLAVQIFIMGIILGFLAWRTDSVVPGIIAHGLNNLMSLIFINSETESVEDWYLTANHINPIILLPAIIILVWSIRQITYIYKSNSE